MSLSFSNVILLFACWFWLSLELTDENLCSKPCEFCCREKECRDRETCEGNYKPFVIAGSVIGSVLFLCVVRFSYKKFKLRKSKKAEDKKVEVSKDVKPKKSPSEGEIVKSVRGEQPAVAANTNAPAKDVFAIDDESNPKKKKGSNSDRSKNKKKKAPTKVKSGENLKERLNKTPENSSAVVMPRSENASANPGAGAVESNGKPKEAKKEANSKAASKAPAEKKSSKLPAPQHKEYSSLDSQKEVGGGEELNSRISLSNREVTNEHDISIKINDEI